MNSRGILSVRGGFVVKVLIFFHRAAFKVALKHESAKQIILLGSPLWQDLQISNLLIAPGTDMLPSKFGFLFFFFSFPRVASRNDHVLVLRWRCRWIEADFRWFRRTVRADSGAASGDSFEQWMRSRWWKRWMLLIGSHSGTDLRFGSRRWREHFVGA